MRAATSGDVEALGRLGTLLVATHHAFDRARFFAATEDMPRGYGEFLASQIGKRGRVLRVAEVDGEVVGYCLGGLEGTDWMALRGRAGLVYDLIVDPAHRGGGIGAALFEAVMAELTRLGAPQILLFTAAANEHAQRLFARHGFRQTMIEMTREV